ncbi:MAG: hypothetical protein PHD01_10645 [Geobacteraceae bacterium]|nr:hypothetical protein [Geobacteraceae bacterium]
MDPKRYLLRAIRKLWRTTHSICHLSRTERDTCKEQLYEEYVKFYDQEANELVREHLSRGNPCMISKFGMVELSALVNYSSLQQEHYSMLDFINYVRGDRQYLWWIDSLKSLCTNAGFFPSDEASFHNFCKLYIHDIKEIDILGSYIREESYFDRELANAIRVNLDGYYAPFFYSNPWTVVLKGKKILVIHPFEDSIQKQYSLRTKIWDNPDILPEFELKTLRAVQTIAGEKSEYKNWFEALNAMKERTSSIDFDIALIGCGAYGLPLSAHVKRMGKQAVHLAGWTQVLFGIKGKRWIDNPRVARLMNRYWAHPLSSEVPQKYRTIEGGCYW